MPFVISPIHTDQDFEGQLTLEDKIEVFIARVKGWQIQPALAMIEKQIPHRGFAQLLIVVSFFEMIGKYRAGYKGGGNSGKYFKEGLLYIFPEIPEYDIHLLKSFYKGVRNGLYHVGMTMPNVVLYDNIPGSFGFQEETGAILISPDQFVHDIAIRFESFANELRDKHNEELRTNFGQRFDDDNSH